MRVLELKPRVQALINDISVTPYVVSADHVRDSPSFALRVESDGRILTYSGDADWCDELAEAAQEADLFVCEAYFYEKEIKYHINLRSLGKTPAGNPRQAAHSHTYERRHAPPKQHNRS